MNVIYIHTLYYSIIPIIIIIQSTLFYYKLNKLNSLIREVEGKKVNLIVNLTNDNSNN